MDYMQIALLVLAIAGVWAVIELALTIRKAPYQVRIIKRNTHKYFHTLREKMMWGADSR